MTTKQRCDRARYDRRVAARQCVRCGVPLDGPGTMCRMHLERAREARARYEASLRISLDGNAANVGQ